MARWPAAIALILCGCGRIGFDLSRSIEEDAGAGNVVDAAPAQADERRVLIGVQGTNRSHLVSLLWDPNSNLPARLAEPPLMLSAIGNDRLRSVARADTNTVLVGDGSNPRGVFVSASPLAELAPMVIVDGTVANAHGTCVLPGGNIIVGEYSNGSANEVVEYSGPGDSLTRVQDVYTTTVTRGALSICHAPSDNELYITDSDATTELDTDLVRLTKTGNVWSEAARFDLSNFANATYGVHNTPVWTFAVLQDAIYSFPSHRHTTLIPNLIRCSLPGLDSCVELGPLPPDAADTQFDPDMIHGAAGVPGTRQLLFTTGRALYRYDLDTDRYSELFDLALDAPLVNAAGLPDPLLIVRHIVVF